jgi:hypothetical protein
MFAFPLYREGGAQSFKMEVELSSFVSVLKALEGEMERRRVPDTLLAKWETLTYPNSLFSQTVK